MSLNQFQEGLESQIGENVAQVEAGLKAQQDKINAHWDKVTAVHEELGMVGATLMGAMQGVRGRLDKFKSGLAKTYEDAGITPEQTGPLTFHSGLFEKGRSGAVDSDGLEFGNNSGFSDIPRSTSLKSGSERPTYSTNDSSNPAFETTPPGELEGDISLNDLGLERQIKAIQDRSTGPIGGQYEEVDLGGGGATATIESNIERETTTGGFGGRAAGSIGGADAAPTFGRDLQVPRGLPEDAPFETLFPNPPVKELGLPTSISSEGGTNVLTKAGQIRAGLVEAGENPAVNLGDLSGAILSRGGGGGGARPPVAEEDEDAIVPAPTTANITQAAERQGGNLRQAIQSKLGLDDEPLLAAGGTEEQGIGAGIKAAIGGDTAPLIQAAKSKVTSAITDAGGADLLGTGEALGASIGSAVAEGIPVIGQVVGAGILLGSVLNELKGNKDSPVHQQGGFMEESGFSPGAIEDRIGAAASGGSIY